MTIIRQPIVALVGHVDHGKSSILEKIRGISITSHEPGLITQMIKAYSISLNNIKNFCGSLLDQLKIKLTIPGILFIDTPGHAAFTNLRKRGGSIADIAILVIDVNEGLKPQTMEAIDILKSYKTPFIIALNKIDAISGWHSKKDNGLIKSIEMQNENVRNLLDTKLYEIVGRLYDHGIKTERFDRIDDYTKQIAIIPLSAKTLEGIPEMLVVLTGLAQRFLEKKLEIKFGENGKGIILEVKEEKNTGIVLDAILYDGVLNANDILVIGGIEKATVTKVKSILVQERNDYKSIKSINAAAAIRIIASDVKEVVSGMPFVTANNNIDNAKEMVQKDITDVLIETEKEGIIIKADSLGSLEALIHMLKEKGFCIKRASIGNITKKDMADASAEKDQLSRVILAFNVEYDGEQNNVKIISNNVIYKIIEDFDKWHLEEKREIEKKELKNVVIPAKIMLLNDCVFRQSNPAVVGVEVLGGTLKVGMKLARDGKSISRVKEIQHEMKSISEAACPKQVAIALPDVIVGRQIKEGDVLYTDISEQDFIKLKGLKRFLNDKEIDILKEIADIKRKENKLWGV